MEWKKVVTGQESFPDGTPIDPWFYDTGVPELSKLGQQYVLTDYGVRDDGQVHTALIQSVIDRAAVTGGVIVVPQGTYRTGSLYWKQGVHLYVAEGGVLMGSDDISDYDLVQTRIEGQTCLYFAAMINAHGLDGVTICGPGTIDGNGMRSWRAFWLRRTWNPACTNMDEQRPRLLFFSECSNVTVSGVRLQNSHFWTTHLYRCDHVRYLGCTFFSPTEPVRAPSTDAIDLDVCHDVLIKNCVFSVNDDAVALKGGKGPWADTAPENGANERIIVEDCEYLFCHGCLTCGSESVHDRNIIVRRITVQGGNNLLWLKLRPDTPQHYEYIRVEQASGKIENFLNINAWSQFYDPQGRTDIPTSRVHHIEMSNCSFECNTFFHVHVDQSRYAISDNVLHDLDISAGQQGTWREYADGVELRDVCFFPDTTASDRGI